MPFILVFAAVSYLSLARLDHTLFWDDEAQVAIVARNYLRLGRLTGWDGRNLYAYQNGAILDESLRPINPPLDYLTCALSSKSHLPVTQLEKQGAALLEDRHFPDWFVAFGAHFQVRDKLTFFSRPHTRDGQELSYRYEKVHTLPVYWFDTSRPELPWHTFGPKTDFDPATEGVYIYRRLGAAPGE